jgi:hypothetical protein
MPLESLESTRVAELFPDFGVWSPTIVDVDDERLKVLASGARCVSLSFLVSFQDMITAVTGTWRKKVRAVGRADLESAEWSLGEQEAVVGCG